MITSNVLSKPLNFDNYTFRAHMCGKLMCQPKGTHPKIKLEEIEFEIKEKKTTILDKIKEIQEKIDGWDAAKKEQKGYLKLEADLAKQQGYLSSKLIPLQEEYAKYKKLAELPFISSTTIRALIAIYIEERTGVSKQLFNKYIEKGLAVEDEAIAILGELDGRFYVKNTERIYNEFIQGECDIDDVEETKTTQDVKASFELETFYPKLIEPLDDDYYWQGQDYMELYGAEEHLVRFVLVDTPTPLIEDEYRRALYKIGTAKKDTQEYYDICSEIDKRMVYDLPINERVITHKVKRNPEAIRQLYVRIPECRSWLNMFAQADFERSLNGTIIEYVDAIVKLEQEANVDPVIAVSTNEEYTPTEKEASDAGASILQTSAEVMSGSVTENTQKLFVEKKSETRDLEDQIQEMHESKHWYFSQKTGYVYMSEAEYNGLDKKNNEGLIRLCVVESGLPKEAEEAHVKYLKDQESLKTAIVESAANVQPPAVTYPVVVNLQDANPESIAALQPESDINKLLEAVEKCKVYTDCTDLYKTTREQYASSIEYKTALDAKRDSLHPESQKNQENATQPAAIKNRIPRAPSSNGKSDRPDFIINGVNYNTILSEFKTPQEVRELYNKPEHKDVINVNESLKDAFIKKGQELTAKEKNTKKA